MSSDLFNGLFEAVGGLLVLLHVFQVHRDRTVRGVAWFPFLFFTAWGWWNLYFYPSVDCWWSFAGGVVMVTVNSYYCFCLWRFWPRDR